MTAPSRRDEPPADRGPAVAPAVATICPYLLSGDGAWRAARPMREHVCTAGRPPLPLTLDRQRRLCLTARHAACPLFEAAREARAQALGDHGVDPQRLASLRWLAPRPVVPLALDRPSTIPGLPVPSPGARRNAQAALAGVMVLAAVLLVGARLTGLGLVGASPSPSPSPPPATASPTPSPSASPTSATTASPVPTVTPSPSASASPAPARTYIVQKGDTLSAIAPQFGTTVSALMQLNGLTSSLIHVGQVLRLL